MRKTLLIWGFLLACMGLSAQDYQLNLHNSGSVIYQNNVNAIETIRFQNGNPSNMLINQTDGTYTIPITQFDSITFSLQQVPLGDTVYITYSSSSVQVTNPFADSGVTVSTSGTNVTVNSTMANVPYIVSGTSTNGSLTMYSNSSFYMILSSLNLTSNSTAAVNLASNVNATLALRGTSSLTDNANSTINGAFYAAGDLTIGGAGTLQITGNAKHGLSVDGALTVNSGILRIFDTDSDGIHCSDNLTWNGGTLDIVSAGSDGLDVSGDVTIQNGDLSINTMAETQRSIKVSGVFTMNNGSLDINTSGTDSKGIKADSLVYINGGNLTIVHSGDISKGIKADTDIYISGGTINITSSGTTVVTDYNPSYCTAIKSDANVIISGGDITIDLPTSNHGGKGISCAGNMSISGNNTINIETHGDGATYNGSSGTTDTYSSSCLRAEGNMEILSGNITLSCTGKGGKGIKVGTKTGNTYTGTYTQGNTDGTGPTLTISTTGAQISTGGGGGWPPPGPGGGSSSGSAKAIKMGGLATINGGSTTITTTKSGAEGLESKTAINIEGGQHYFHCYDDCINSSGNITFNSGVTVCFSNGNDAVDSNAGHAGAITIGNGVAFAYTTKGSPEEGFDCDNNNYIRITGTGIGISAGGSQGGGWPPGGGGSGGTITNPAQGYKFYTNSYNFQAGRYYTLSNASGSGGNNMVTFSFEANCNSTLALITATGMVSGNTYYVNYGAQAPTNPTTEFHGLFLGGTSSASTQAFSFTAQ